MIVLTRNQVREVDRRAMEDYGVPSVVLMENAGRGVVDVLMREGIRGPFLICCGKGNNAGDGFVIARHLDLLGHEVRVLLVGEPERLTGDAAKNHYILARTDVVIVRCDRERDLSTLDDEIQQSACVVDALLGTGAKGSPRPPLDRMIDKMNSSDVVRVAVDIPSGLDCDTGSTAGTVFRADHTCTFVAAKPGLLVPASQAYVGRLHIVHIGISSQLAKDVSGHSHAFESAPKKQE